jgi:single-strand DNA-binding protein
MPSLNKVTLIGHLGQDPEIKTFSTGSRVANLNLATSESWKDKASGEKKTATEWHRISVFNEHAIKFLESYAVKGSLVYVEGKLETRKWQDKDGQDRTTTQIAVRPYGGDVLILSRDKGNAASPAKQEQPYSAAAKEAATFPDDEVPF